MLREEEKKPSLGSREITVVIICAVLILTVIAISTIGIVSAVVQSRPFNYLTDDLSKYIYISREDYTNFEAEKRLTPVTDLSVDNAVIKLLAENRGEAKNDGNYVKTSAIGAGDVVCVYYRSYIIDANGREIDLSGLNNFNSNSETEITIGSGKMPLGFETGLVGVVPKDHTVFTKITEGKVTEGSVAYLDYKCLDAEGITSSYTGVRVELGESADAIYGAGFSAYVVGSEINSTNTSTFSVQKPGDVQQTYYYDLKVKFITECESDPIVIEGYVPDDYTDATLRGQKLYFDVYVKYFIDYEAPEFNDAFVTETLKVEESTLADLSGDTVALKYRAFLRKELEEKYEDDLFTSVETQMWDHHNSKATVIKLPTNEVNKFYDEYFTEVMTQYSYYQDQFETVDAFARAYLEIGSNDNWREYLVEFASQTVMQKLVFYYIIRQENLIPNESEYAALYDEIFDECLDAYLKDIEFEREDYKTEEEYLAALEENKKIVKDYYTERYLRESVYYRFAIDTLVDYATVK